MKRRRFLLVGAHLLAGCVTPLAATRRPPPTPTLGPVPVSTLPPDLASPTAAQPLAAAQTVALPLVVSPTPPPPWRFAVLGDTRTDGLDPPAITGQLAQLAAARQPDVTLATGDLIKALETQADVREQWVRWKAAVAPLGVGAQASPWLLPTPGNHDVEDNAFATDLMAEAFPDLPENGPPGLLRLTYSSDYRGVRFISLHSEIFGDAHRFGAAQLAWLETQLASSPGRHTFVFSHDPAFPVGPHIGSSLDVYPQERDQFWALLKQYRVSAYVCGHEHLYNRQTIDGVLQLIVGTSGSFPYPGVGGDFYHYLMAEVSGDEVEMAVYDSDNLERDRFTIV
jgi:3',5'-cyclic-AMP phosphodiesterase